MSVSLDWFLRFVDQCVDKLTGISDERDDTVVYEIVKRFSTARPSFEFIAVQARSVVLPYRLTTGRVLNALDRLTLAERISVTWDNGSIGFVVPSNAAGDELLAPTTLSVVIHPGPQQLGPPRQERSHV
jgi:hypothetical protein